MVFRNRWTIGLALAVVASIGPWVGGARAAACRRPAQAAVFNLIEEDGKIRYDHTKSRARIKAIASKMKKGKGRAGGITMGLTASEFAISFHTNITIEQVGEFKYCAWLNKADVRVGFPLTTVFIDRKYAKRSCQYKAILRHENKHVLIYTRGMNTYIQKIRKRIRQAIDRHPWILARSRKEAKDAYVKLLEKRVSPLIEAMRRERDRHDAVLDSAKSYQATQKSCADW